MSRVFVVDDSISVCIAIQKMLRGQGFEVATARSGQEAFEHLRRHRPDLVICDLVLPDLDGTEICSFVRREPRLSATPVIAISGLVDAQVERAAEQAGVMRVLKKPFSAEDLRRAIEAAFERAGDSDTAQASPSSAGGRHEVELASLVEDAKALPSLRFGLIVGFDGEVEVHFGRQPDEELEEVVAALIELVRRSASVAGWLGHTDPHQLVLQADDGIICCQRYGDRLIVLALADATLLGKARLTLARLRRRADRRVRALSFTTQRGGNE